MCFEGDQRRSFLGDRKPRGSHGYASTRTGVISSGMLSFWVHFFA